MSTTITPEFIRRIPKTDLHVHLDGSLRIGTLIDLAQKEHIELPADDHKEAFGFAHKHFLRKTVHAGEAYGPESMFQAITD